MAVVNCFIERIRAWWGGYFWRPCLRCGKSFGGHELAEDRFGDWHTLGTLLGETYSMCCPSCCSDGFGYARVRARIFMPCQGNTGNPPPTFSTTGSALYVEDRS